MYFRRFYDKGLAQASYLIGCQQTGEAVVIDPNRDVQHYIDGARSEKLRITHVTETHIHADFVSGSRELTQRTGAKLLLSDEGGDDWRYSFAEGAGAQLLKGGDHFIVGNIRLDVVHTPGHTPEHICFVVTDLPAGAGAWGVITGDFVFVGDVGRPDLLEKAAGLTGTMDAAARTLFRSLNWFRSLPDHLQVWPGHGAGSACGKALGAIPSSTVGYEKIGNWGVASTDEDAFVNEVLSGQPEPPRYFAEMKRVNKMGPRILGTPTQPRPLPDTALQALLLESGATVVDTRSAKAYAAGHAAGTINIPLNGSFINWAGSLLPYDRDLFLIVDGEAAEGAAARAVRDLSMIGLDRIGGVFGTHAVDAWSSAGHALQTTRVIDAATAADLVSRGEVTLLDVRAKSEWDEGHIAGAHHIPLGSLPTRLDEIPAAKPLLVYCESGSRSAIAASVLQLHDRLDVMNLGGGIVGWQKAELPVELSDARGAAVVA